MNVFIDNLKNHRKSVSLESIFGKDSLKLYKTCEAIWLGWLHPYKGCIVAKIASDHNATITWCGTNNAERGDQWMVSQNNEQLGVFTV